MRRTRRGLVAVAGVICLASCSSTVTSSHGTFTAHTSATPSPTPKAQPAARITITPRHGEKSVPPLAHVTVTATHGSLSRVEVTDNHGHRLIGRANRTGTRWVSRGALAYKAVYSVHAVARDAHGLLTRATSSFHSAWPRKQVFPAISPLGGQKVGVGMPVVVYFSHPVADPNEVQKHLSVTSSPAQTGAWHWFGHNTEAHWRPRDYWKAHTTVTVKANIFGLDLGAGYWGKSNHMTVFHIGDRHVSIANSITHHMAVYDGTKRVQNFPVSMGKEVKGRWTHSGIHVVNARNSVKHMDSTTFGLALDAGGYRATVKYATRISNNGEFVHSAPWSVKQQGHSNASHGCINLSPTRAKWFFNFSRIGDVVQVVGTPVPLTPADGDIYDWSIPWSTWVR